MNTAETANEVTATAGRTITARYNMTRFDLPEGREWLVTSDSGWSYVVLVWTDKRFGRMAKCSCEAGRFGKPCKHVRFIQVADSILTEAPIREIRPVYEGQEAESEELVTV